MALQYSTTHRTNEATDVVTQAGATSYILIYTGTPPASCATAASGTLLASLACSATFGTVTTGVLTANAITSTTGAAAGVAGYFRLCTTSAGTTTVLQGTVTATGGGGDLELNNTSISAGQTVSISSFVYTSPGA